MGKAHLSLKLTCELKMEQRNCEEYGYGILREVYFQFYR